MKYVSDSNLSRFLTKLKGIFAKKSEVPSQADLDAKLSLSGGTMTGAIQSPNGVIIKDANNRNVLECTRLGAGSMVTVGSSLTNVGISSNGPMPHTVGGVGGYVFLDTYNTEANPTLTGTEAALDGLKINGTSYKNQPASVQYLTTAPSSANTDGLKIVVLSSESGVTKQSGYLYLVL